MSIKTNIKNNLNRIAEISGMIEPFLFNALKNNPLNITNPHIKNIAGNATNYLEFWQQSYGDKFFQMGTFIRLGSEIENSFRYYYMDKKGHANAVALQNDPKVKGGGFQRIQRNNSLQQLYNEELSIDLESMQSFKKIKEFMVARHLYTHRSGLLDEKFIDDWKKFTNEDLMNDSDIINSGYPAEDTYWFRPLKSIWDYKNAATKLFNDLP